MDIERIREDFPVTKRWIYLMNCRESPFCKPVAKAVQEQGIEEQLFKHKPGHEWMGILEEGRKEAARLLGADPAEIAYIRGTTEGVNIVASMLDWRAGENIVLSDIEFSSNVFPWMRQAKVHGIQLRPVPHREGAIDTNDIRKAIDTRTKVVAISHVQKHSGFKCDLREVAELAHDAGAYLVVDAVQSVGALDVDVKMEDVDFLVAGAHKFLIGPSAMGIMYVRQDLIEKFEPLFVGPWQQEEIFDFTYHEYVLAKTARRFEFGGHPNLLGAPGLLAAIKYLNAIGIDNIEKRNLSLVERLIDGLKSRKANIPSWLDDRRNRSSIVGIRIKDNANELTAKLRERDILVAPSIITGEQTVRIGLHFFNTEEEIDKLFAALDELGL